MTSGSPPSDRPRTTSGDLPDGIRLVRTTPVFDESSVPAGLLAAHQLADGVWARLVVQQGSVDFAFEDSPENPVHLGPASTLVVPPQRLHHVVVVGPVRFVLELYR